MMTLHEVKKYYGKSYRKILDCLMILVDTFQFEVDKSCGRYLELECKDEKGCYIKVNHGISDEDRYNIWYRRDRWEETKREHFRSQNEVVEYIEKIFWYKK